MPRRYINIHHQASIQPPLQPSPPPLPPQTSVPEDVKSVALSEKRRRSRHGVCPISSMVAKMKSGLFARSYTNIASNSGQERAALTEDKASTNIRGSGGILSRDSGSLGDTVSPLSLQQ